MNIVTKTINKSKIFVKNNLIAKSYDKDLSKMFRWMKNINISKNPVIFDVGANIGIFSLSYASIFKSAKVYSFEPVDYIFEILRTNIYKNKNFKNRIFPFNLGFSDSRKNIKLGIPNSKQHPRYDPKKNSINVGLFSIYGSKKSTVNAKFVTLDDFVKSKKIQKLDFIKIDVEGHEYNVLKGAIKTIKKFKPIIIFEFNDLTRALSTYSVSDYFSIIKKMNYKIYGLKYGWPKTLIPIKSLNKVDKISDLVIIKESNKNII